MEFLIEDGIPPPSAPAQADAPPTSKTLGLIGWLRTLRKGQSILVPGKKARNVGSHIRAARRGTDKWFESKTVTTGVRIWRTE